MFFLTSGDHRLNEKAAFASALSDVSWEHLYAMTTCEEQFNFFQRTMEELMVTHFPYKYVTRHTADKQEPQGEQCCALMGYSWVNMT